jgi:hypothetical protein
LRRLRIDITRDGMPLSSHWHAWYRSSVRRRTHALYRVFTPFGRASGHRVWRFGLGLVLGTALAASAPLASAEPPTTHEIIYTRPSGFWTSNRPAVGGAYRWRLLGIGVVVLAVTGYAMLRLVRRANAERAARR